MRRVAGTVALVACICAAAAAAAGEPQVQFPRDHFGHSAASIEWWYFTALAHDNAGTPYSVFFTLFSSNGGLVPVAQVRNLATGGVVGHSEQLVPGRVGPAPVDVSAGDSRLRYVPGSNTWLFSVTSPGLQVSLSERPEKPYALHGRGTGVIRQSPSASSHYYSATRMRATGTMRVRGKTVGLAGESWFDHQWGDYRDDPSAFNWDWFSCRFDDHTELMLYQFRDRRTGRPLPRSGSGTFVGRDGTTIAVDAFQATSEGGTLHAAGRRWPLDWRLRVPKLRLSESVRSLLRDQLVRNAVVPTFWEGVARATGARTGACFVEISYR